MKKKDHRALGAAIADLTQDPLLLKHRKAFLLGCVEPDYNVLTYLRGIFKHRNVYGHHEQNIEQHIRRLTRRLKKKGIKTAADCFRLGTLIHYIADTFTYPHTKHYKGSMAEHILYEQKLHMQFQKTVNSLKYEIWEPLKTRSAAAVRSSYEALPNSVQKDCQYIISSCIKTVTDLIPGDSLGYLMPGGAAAVKRKSRR